MFLYFLPSQNPGSWLSEVWQLQWCWQECHGKVRRTISQTAAWPCIGFDVLDCELNYHGSRRYTKMSNAMKKYGKNIFFSLCEWWVLLFITVLDGQRHIKHCWFTLLCFCCLGEKKTLLHGQVAWVIAGGQLTTSPTTGTGAAHFINSRFLVKYLLELAGLIISYVVTSAWHPALTRTTDGPPTPDLVDGTVRVSDVSVQVLAIA